MTPTPPFMLAENKGAESLEASDDEFWDARSFASSSSFCSTTAPCSPGEPPKAYPESNSPIQILKSWREDD